MDYEKAIKDAEIKLEGIIQQIGEASIELEGIQKQIKTLAASRDSDIKSVDKIIWDAKGEAGKIVTAAKAESDQILAAANESKTQAADERAILNQLSLDLAAREKVIPDGLAQLQKDRDDFEKARSGKLEELDAQIKTVKETQAKLEAQMAIVTSVQVSNDEKAKKVDAQIIELASLIENNKTKAETNSAKESELIAREAVLDNRAIDVEKDKVANKAEAERLLGVNNDLSAREVQVNKTASDNEARKISLDAQEKEISDKNAVLQTGMSTLADGQDALKDKVRANALKERDIDDKIKTLKTLREQPVK
jgi:DNA repair exonuclease SbcCD ATPase subunit